jgi:hypothetical protein
LQTAPVDFVARQLTARAIASHASASAGEPIHGYEVALRLLNRVKAIVLHAFFLDRRRVGLAAILRAAKAFVR